MSDAKDTGSQETPIDATPEPPATKKSASKPKTTASKPKAGASKSKTGATTAKAEIATVADAQGPADTPAEGAQATAEAVEEATEAAKARVDANTTEANPVVAEAADSAAETVADAANEAATEAAATTAAADAANETAATQAHHPDAPVRTVYVTAPTPPAPKGNRVLGILIGLLAAAVFATIYAAVFALLRIAQGGSPAADLPAFLGSASFIFPIVILLVAFILWALIVNRAGWWAWILGSFLIAIAVYTGTVGLAQLFYQVQIPWTEPALIASAVLARETSVWLGGILSARGKRLKVRNAEARAQFDREEAERRAERERHA